MGVFGGSLLVLLFIHAFVVPCLHVLFVAGLASIGLTLVMFLLQYFTVLQIITFAVGIGLFIITWKWCRSHEEEEEEEQEDDVHHSVLYKNPFVRGGVRFM